MSTFTLADSFDATEPRHAVDLNAPLPLGYTEAVRRATSLRDKGTAWSYPVIADVMAEYHGFRRCAEWWRTELRARGALPRPSGLPFGGRS